MTPRTPYDGRMNPVIDATGQQFYSQQDCAFAYDRHPRTVWHHLATHGDLSKLGTGNSRDISGGKHPKAKPFKAGPFSWPTAKDAAADLGVSARTITRSSGPNASEAQRRNLAQAVMAYGIARRGEVSA